MRGINGDIDQLWGQIMTNAQSAWTVIVLAGQRPGVDRLASHFGEELKALVPLDGEAMITRVVRTLHASSAVGRIVILSQAPERLRAAVEAGGGGELVESGGGISASINAIVGTDKAPWPVLVTTADHPLLTPQMVEAFLEGSTGADLNIGMVERGTMMAAFPQSQRTWLKFRDGHWSGANLFTLTSERTLAALTLWAEAEQDRKVAWKLFLHFGPWLALRAITRTIGLGDALGRAGQRLGLSVKLVAMSDPVAAIDVDKPSDHDLARAILAARATGCANA